MKNTERWNFPATPIKPAIALIHHFFLIQQTTIIIASHRIAPTPHLPSLASSSTTL
jgi:hypothetical protein